MTGCDANSGFCGNGRKSVYEQVAKNRVTRLQLSRCGDSLDIEEEVVEELVEYTLYVIYGDNTSSTMVEALFAKWKKLENKSVIRLHPDAGSLRQHCFRRNNLGYLVRHPFPKHHPTRHSVIAGSWWSLSPCVRPALQPHLPA